MKKVLAALVVSFALFFVLTPGVFFTLPDGHANKYTIAAAHAAVFSGALLLVGGALRKFLR
jgi:hypothetical protein